ncbi:MAG: alanine racemase [Alphaproteobacteria bacterium]|nr:alanine racemase [Alphaproteobacteria bacterium]
MTAKKPAYERPSIQRHRAGAMNKMGAIPALRPQRDIDGVPVQELIDAYGSPLFVYSERTIVNKYRELRDAVKRHWPKVQMAWSYKTCYLDAICRIYHREGSWAEAVSEVEVHKAMRNGVPTNKIIFNGPHKSEEGLEEAIRGGMKINIDHFDEMALLEQIAERLGVVPEVGIRLNMAAGAIPRWDRFGFNLDSGQAWDAVRRMLGGGRLRLVGLHAHLGTFILDPEAYREGARKIATFANKLRAELGIRLDYIDLGGGFASKSRLKSQYLPGEQATPAPTQYAEAVTDGLSALEYRHDELPVLILETGRALIDEAGTLIASTIANKRLADGRRAVILDAGVNVLFTSFWYRHNIVPAQPVPGTPEPSVLFGPLCMNIDVVCDHILLPPLNVGDKVLIKPVGAYNVTQSMQFIHLRPAVALIGLDGQHAEIRRVETLDDLVIGESVPDWLK